MSPQRYSVPGIVGGVGPEATASFYLRILEAAKARTMGIRPGVLMASVALPLDTEKAFLAGDRDTVPVYIDAITRAVHDLERAGAHFLAIPSNTVCLLLKSIQGATSLKVLDPISVTIQEIQARRLESVEVLGTSSLVTSDVYGQRLRDAGIQVTYPSAQRQREVDRIIRRVVEGSHVDGDLDSLDTVVGEGLHQEAHGVVVGCTDLHLVFAKRSPQRRIVDSLSSLADAVARNIAEPPPRRTT